MAINYGKIRYLKTCATTKDLPDETLPEIVLAGRSNVGKSSLVNALGGNKKLARVSQTPGKTQQIIYFDMDGQAILADLPGYGFSKASKDRSKGFSELCDNYFRVRKGIDLVLLLIDIRHEPSNDDIGMLNYLNSVGLPYFWSSQNVTSFLPSRSENSFRRCQIVLILLKMPVFSRFLRVRPIRKNQE